MSEQKPPFTPISSIGEFKLIDRIVEGFENFNASTIKGVGDDAAVLLPLPGPGHLCGLPARRVGWV